MFVIWSHGTGFIMSHQLTFADSEFSSKRRQTRKEIFLSRMEQILPWQNMVEVIEPFYPKAGNGRRPYPLETMLRIHCMQHWGSRDFPSKNDKVLWRPRRPWPPEGYYFSLTGKYPSIERISSSRSGNFSLNSKW